MARRSISKEDLNVASEGDRNVAFSPNVAAFNAEGSKEELPLAEEGAAVSVVDLITSDSQVTITFEELSYSIDVEKPRSFKERLSCKRAEYEEKFLLKDVTGAIKPRQMTALMGPSGAGKSTLLDVIAGRKNSGVITGSLLFNGRERTHEFKRVCGYVEQADILLGSLTVRELLTFTARLRLSKTFPEDMRMKRVEEVIDQLGLKGCADVLIGDGKQRGISGGQAKRVNIGVELITSPSMLFLDEPTSGLDSSTAFDVMKVARHICDAGTTVICTIHQPSSDIFRLFDRLLLLVAGEVVYLGSAMDAPTYFQNLGYVLTENMNPADFIIEVTSDHSSGHKLVEGPDVDRHFFAETYKKSALADLRKISTKRATETGPKTLKEDEPLFINDALYNMRVLFDRQVAKGRRDPGFFGRRVLMPLVVAVILALVYRDSPFSQQGVRNRQALIMLMVNYFTLGANQMIGPLMAERLFFTRERASASYQVSSYYLSILLFEFPFAVIKALIWSIILYWSVGFYPEPGNFFFFCLIIVLLADMGNAMAQFFGAIAPSFEAGAAAMTTFPLMFTIFSGFYIKKANIPTPWIWAYYISYCNYAVAALIFNEFKNQDKYFLVDTYCFQPANVTAAYCPLDPSSPAACASTLTAETPWPPSEVLAYLGAPTGFFDNAYTNLFLFIVIWFAIRVVAYLALRFKRHGSR